MRARTIVLTLALCFVGVAVCFADDAQMGTWKLNEAKSKFSPGTTKNTTVVYQAAGDNVKVTVDGIDSDAKPTHNEWTGKFDGKDYPVTGDSYSDARSYKKVNDRTLTFTGKKNGKVTITGRIVLSADGKSRTVTASGTDPKGNKVSWTAAYDKQ
jgi:formylglycine-generating enzyme required for sulfatase activity